MKALELANHKFGRLLKADGSWARFKANWADQCAAVGEDPADFATDALQVIEQFSEKDDSANWAVAVSGDDDFLGACVVIRAQLPGTSGWTLRVRQIVVSPKLDYGEIDSVVYADTLIELIYGVIKLSESELMSEHIKFHLRSPHDMEFFRHMRNGLDSQSVFRVVEMKGAWLYITKV